MAATEKIKPYRIDVADAIRVWDEACGSTPAQFHLVPAEAIARYDATHERPLERVPLSGWTAFEYGHLDWDHEDFARLLGLEEIPEELPLILVTDEGLREECAFRFRRARFPSFVNRYEDAYGMDFFQSADYLLFDVRLFYIRILHHEGVVFRDGNRRPSRARPVS